MKFKTLSLAALTLMGAIITACSSSDDTIADTPQPVITPQQPENTSKTVTLTTTVGLGDGSATTRALTIDYNQQQCVKTFAAGDQMAVIYKNTSGDTKKAVADITSGDGTKSATFTVTLEDPKTDAPIRYIYPAVIAKDDIATDAAIDDDGTVDLTNLASQNGTLATLGSALDLCTYDATNWTSGELPSGTLLNQLAVLAVTVKDDKATADAADDEQVTTSVTRLTVSDGTNKYTATGRDADGHIYLAVLPTTSADITVDIYTGDYATTGHHYVKALAEKKSYAASNLYNVGWKVNQYAEPMTMEATTTGTIVVNDPRWGMKYSLNGDDKDYVSNVGGTINVEAGDKVEFYGNSATYFDRDDNRTTIAGGTANVKLYGNIMSLVDEAGFATATTLTAESTFNRLFNGNTVLTDASGLLLPATTLSEVCYHRMFWGCTSLTAAPAELPAPTLTQDCYCLMFLDCSSLETAPTLPATTLAVVCYNGMFSGCSSLETAPALPATTLAEGCYSSMFDGCTSLTTAPALPATELAEGCYYGMFSGCTNLSAVTCLATDISAKECTIEWLDGVAATGTFTTPSSTNWSTDADGIPDGWTRVDY